MRFSLGGLAVLICLAAAGSTWIPSGLALAPPGREEWADPKLPAIEGLALWIDASRQESAWKTNGKNLADNGRMDVCYDGSGHRRHVIQTVQRAQPRFLQAGGHRILRFDGQDGFFSVSNLNLSLNEFTLLLVAAPRSNAGGFRALVAAAETGKNDYQTGFTVDLGPGSTPVFQQLNVEGKGFGTWRNLMTQALPLGEFATLEVTGRANEVALAVNGQPGDRRPRSAGPMRLDSLYLGARCYSNTPEPPQVSGHLDGDLAEVLLFDRALSADEAGEVRGYLAAKHAGLSAALSARDRTKGRILRPIANPPPVQVLVPGFVVRELPLDLTNINNLRYRRDGKLLALGYNGDIHLLTDTDGDGLEDRAALFWENGGRIQSPLGVALTPPGLPQGNGLFVASKGKLVLITDTDGDDRADQVLTVAEGWKELPHGVDALGVALAADGSIYFGLGTANYANGYLINKEGKAEYDLAGERGTILRVSPDFKKREMVCTGIRFPVALAFNRWGDLFATDQEGATWLPNGNPLDELLHILPGRHYGFPPRHPVHLPKVIDEPSVFDYGPQHQSTCGLHFNDPVNGGAVFGPDAWSGDALVCGESRGKLYRTKLVKTGAGYVARNQLLACLSMLTVDAAVSPRGNLVVAAHSGPPDWGTGPLGKGKLFQIAYAHRDAPQPVLAWTAAPGEVRVAFDRPLDPLLLRDLARNTSIEYGPHVMPGDRFEVLKPPYAIVQAQTATPRRDLRILSAQITPDQRTLVLVTEPGKEATNYALTLPGWGRPSQPPSALPQAAAIDLGFDLSGLQAAWTPRDASLGTGWNGWLPHPNLAVCRELTAGSAEHDSLWRKIVRPGQLVLRTQLSLANMLRPAVQPGSQLDYTPAPETVTVHLASPSALQAASLGGKVIHGRDDRGRHRARLEAVARPGELVPLEITLATGAADLELEAWFTTAEDPRPRPMALRRFLVPWAVLEPRPAGEMARREVPELAGGDWGRGQRLYFSEQAQCGKCHAIRGQGGRIGPDLSNLVQRDYASVLRDLVDPSAALNPDYLTQVVELKDGRVLTGVVRTENAETLLVGDTTGKETTVRRQDIQAMKPSPLSTMPKDLDKALGAAGLRDLMTYLLTEPLAASPLSRQGAPPPRGREEVNRLLKDRQPPKGPARPLHVALVAGPKDHGPGEHDYPLWQRRWVNLLSLADNVRVSEAQGWPTPRQLETADVIVLYSANLAWSAARGKEIDAYLERGGGLVLLHWAVNGGQAADAWAERIGLAGRPGMKYRHGPLDLVFPKPDHPITRGLDRVRFVDESYWNMAGDPGKIDVLATATEEGQPRPLLWTREQGRGRVFVSILGHYTWTFDDPVFRVLVLRGLAWTAHEPPSRFLDLATVGARLAE